MENSTKNKRLKINELRFYIKKYCVNKIRAGNHFIVGTT